MDYYIQPYKINSESSKRLAHALGIKRIRPENSSYVPKPHHVIINWGSKIHHPHVKYLNRPDLVAVATRKDKTFELLSNFTRIPAYTTDHGEAYSWILNGAIVLARHLLTASEGDGIVVCRTVEELMANQTAKLFVKYIKKRSEYRVHVFRGEVIDITEKRRRKDFVGEFVPEIRNYQNGWVFCREDIEVPSCVIKSAQKAIAGLELDFGGVDVIFNEKQQAAYVLEVNTAPGIEGTTLDCYVRAIQQYQEHSDPTRAKAKPLSNNF